MYILLIKDPRDNPDFQEREVPRDPEVIRVLRELSVNRELRVWWATLVHPDRRGQLVIRVQLVNRGPQAPWVHSDPRDQRDSQESQVKPALKVIFCFNLCNYIEMKWQN